MTRVIHLTGELSPREVEAATLVTAALTNEEIARRMGVSVKTVKEFLRGARAKLDIPERDGTVNQRVALALKWQARGEDERTGNH